MTTSLQAAVASRDARGASDYDRFCAGVESLTGIALTHYRQAQMERRLRSFAERHGCRDLDGYLALLRRDKDALDGFLDRMTINVSELFRNPERFTELAERHLPDLLARAPGGLRAWSAGCSYGAEPYTLSLLLQEVAPGRRHEVIASDIDQVILAKARRGRFTEADVRSVTPERLRTWFTAGTDGDAPVYEAGERLKAIVRFRHHNLLEDRYPDRLDLIACRNVVIYFTDEAKDGIYRRFLQALKPGGVLFVGSTERVHRAEEMGWERAGTFFYRKPLR
ncbi:MAG: protein-glutamate O-methyltransferase CheR [Actinomycetota bacterium]